MIKNRNYSLYELEEYESLNQMICRKAEKCKDMTTFQYMQANNLYNVSYKGFLDDILVAGKYIEDFIKKPTHIAILGENSYQWLVTFMAVVMSGNVAVPLDKELDSAGIQELLISSDSTLCIYSDTYSDIVDKIQSNGEDGDEDETIRFLTMDLPEEAAQNKDTEMDILERWNDSLDSKAMSALFFTSGTSGKSKGVMLSQENMISDIDFACKNFHMSGNTLAVLPFHHSYGLITSIFVPFYWERTIFINTSLKNIKKDMLFSKPQTMLLVPLFVETFYKTIWQTVREQGSEKKLRSGIKLSNFLLKFGIDVRKKLFQPVLDGFGGKLEYIICGGAPLQEKYVKEFRAVGIEILNGYGITECAPVVATNRNYFHRDGSVGQILKCCDVRIEFDTFHSTIDEVGEIQVKGRNVMLGYYRDEKATEEALVDGWFRTGDLGYIDFEGFLYVTGRRKNLIILSNGENVSPEELENLLLENDLVSEVVVYAEDGMITAEIFPNAAECMENMDIISAQLQEIIDACNRHLPAYKRIQRLKVRQSEFEKTTTQKIKR